MSEDAKEFLKQLNQIADYALCDDPGCVTCAEEYKKLIALIEEHDDLMFERGRIRGRYDREADKVEDNL
jgi:hypothetical protein